MSPYRIQRLREGDQVARNQVGSLMNQLVERVLTVGARFAPEYGTRFVRDRLPFQRDMLTVAFHRQLLKIGWKSLEVLLVGQHCNRLGVKEVGVPHRKQSHQ